MSTTLVPVPEMERMAIAIAKSKLFGMKTPEEAMALMVVAQSEGRHPGSVAAEYHIIGGRPALKADAMLARFQAAGGKVQWTEYTDARVAGIFTHPAGGSVEIDWTWQRAMAAGLTEKATWRSYPRQMLRSRVISEGVRTVYPGVVVGTYSVEEMQDNGPEVEVLKAEPPARMSADEELDHLAAIEGAADMDSLRSSYSTAYHAAKQTGDLDRMEKFETAKDARKAALQVAA